ncbi:MAG: S8 family serine peptidase, partial [Chloroflexales bacterium]|nr:S8 family serine peptidase [Chloroflexales bacterium]
QTFSQGAGVTVAVIDTGVQLDHPALAGSLLSTGYDFIDWDTLPEDVPDGIDEDEDGVTDEALGHGSHVAGIVLTVAPEAMILPIRALNAEGVGEIYTLALAIEYALAQGVDVINLSLGTDLNSALLAEIVHHAARVGVLVVAAAGNYGDETPQYPAADPCAVGVTSLDRYRRLAPLATLAPWVDLAAPGEEIYSAMIPGGYGWWSGTSMATPFVSGQAALLLAMRPEASVRQLTAIAAITAHSIRGIAGDAPDRAIDVGDSLEYAYAADYIRSRRSFIPLECVNQADEPSTD